MPEYRCYFLGAAATAFDAPSSRETAGEFLAETDEQARLMAELMYQQRHPQAHGFEIWQGTRLVHRQVTKSKSGL